MLQSSRRWGAVKNLNSTSVSNSTSVCKQNQTFHSYNRHTIYRISNLKAVQNIAARAVNPSYCTVTQAGPAHCNASQVSCRKKHACTAIRVVHL